MLYAQTRVAFGIGKLIRVVKWPLKPIITKIVPKR